MKTTTILKAGMTVAALSMTMMPSKTLADLWKGYSFLSSATHPAYTSLERFAADLEKLSDGEIIPRVNVGGSLPITGSAITTSVADGIITFADDGFYTGNLPIAELAKLPMLVDNQQEFDAMMEVVYPKIAEELEAKGVVLLAAYNFPMQTFWGVDEFNSLEDLRGMKLRVGSPPIAEFAQRFGAVPMTLSTADVAPALERSVVSGIVTASAGGGRIWGDMLRSNYRLPLNYDLMLMIANKNAFDKLLPDVQDAVREAAKQRAKALTAELAALEESVTEELVEKGLAVTRPDDSEIAEARDAIESYWLEWAKAEGTDAEALLSDVRAKLGK